MTEIQSSTCPNCGSPLEVKPGDTRVKCAYCGSSIVVSEHENSTPESPQYQFKIDEQTAQELGTVGKVTAGIALSSIILPLVITVVILCVVGIILVFASSGLHLAGKTTNNPATKPAAAIPLALPTEVPSATTVPSPTPLPTPTFFPTPVPFTNILFRDCLLYTSPSPRDCS